MLAKKTSKNQLTLPTRVVERFPDIEYFHIEVEDDVILLRPVRPEAALEVREKLARLGITERDIGDAVRWARRKNR